MASRVVRPIFVLGDGNDVRQPGMSDTVVCRPSTYLVASIAKLQRIHIQVRDAHMSKYHMVQLQLAATAATTEQPAKHSSIIGQPDLGILRVWNRSLRKLSSPH